MTTAIQSLPILILYPHARCNCRCIMCDIWKDPSRDEISVSELQRHIEDIKKLSVKWVVLSGGEPLMHSDFFRFCRTLRACNVHITVLTTGLLLKRHAALLVDSVDDLIVSLDGPPEIHDRIRRVPNAFQLLAEGVREIRKVNPGFPIAARSTIQRANFAHLRSTARAAKDLGLNSISFMAADVTSAAFNRPQPWSPERQHDVALSPEDIPALELEIEALLREWKDSRFVVEGRTKFSRILQHFRAQVGLGEPVAPQCNAPWVSAVLEANGDVRPCFFHPAIGNVKTGTLLNVVNSFQAQLFRSTLNVATNPVCRNCVCSLNWTGNKATPAIDAECNFEKRTHATF